MDLCLRFENIQYEIKEKKKTKVILKNVSGYAKSGELTVILGPSGAGKTSLLNVLANRCPAMKKSTLSGSLTLNDVELWQDQQRLKEHRKRLGYVMQHPPLSETQTVYESLEFVANLRLSFLPSKEIRQRIEDTIRILKLGDCRNSRLGSAWRGISGGERKRLGIGIEILHRPDIMICDEPTSGLDAAQAGNLMRLLKAWAKADNSIMICTIHQPRSLIFQLTDRIILLDKGEVAYFGGVQEVLPFFADNGRICPVHFNPFDFIIDEVTRDGTKMKLDYTSVHHKFPIVLSFEEKAETKIPKAPFLVQCRELFRRNSRITLRDTFILKTRLGTYIFVTTLVLLIFKDIGIDNQQCNDGIVESCRGQYEDELGFFFFISTNVIFQTSFHTISTFSPEIHVLARERASKLYSLEAFYLSRIFVLVPVECVEIFMFYSIIYVIQGLQSNVFQYFFFIIVSFANILASSGMGITIAAGSKGRVSIATSLCLPCCLCLLMFGGFYIRPESLPSYMQFLYRIGFARFVFQGYLANEYNNQPEAKELMLTRGVDVESDKWLNVVYLTIVCFAHFFVGYLALITFNRTKFLSPNRKKLSFGKMWANKRGETVTGTKIFRKRDT